MAKVKVFVHTSHADADTDADTDADGRAMTLAPFAKKVGQSHGEGNMLKIYGTVEKALS